MHTLKLVLDVLAVAWDVRDRARRVSDLAATIARRVRDGADEWQRVQALREHVRQLQLQLAGCSVVALGYANAESLAAGLYGYGESLDDVLCLRKERDALLATDATLAAVVRVQDERDAALARGERLHAALLALDGTWLLPRCRAPGCRRYATHHESSIAMPLGGADDESALASCDAHVATLHEPRLSGWAGAVRAADIVLRGDATDAASAVEPFDAWSRHQFCLDEALAAIGVARRKPNAS